MFVVVAADQQIATVDEAQAQAEKLATRDNTGRTYVVAQVLGSVEVQRAEPVVTKRDKDGNPVAKIEADAKLEVGEAVTP